jgi:hypothetical protein
VLIVFHPDFDSLKAKYLIFMELTSKRSITDSL